MNKMNNCAFLSQVCINRLHDLQLAMVLTRLYEEPSGGSEYHRVLKDCVLGPTGKTGNWMNLS